MIKHHYFMKERKSQYTLMKTSQNELISFIYHKRCLTKEFWKNNLFSPVQ